MANQWFKFYGGEYLSDPKIERLNPIERSCWITLLCLASMADDGVVRFLTVESLLNKSGIQHDPYNPDDWEKSLSILPKFQEMKMIEILKNADIKITNWEKRQEHNLTVAERVAKHRAKMKNSNKDVTNDVTSVTTEENRVEENKKKYIKKNTSPPKVEKKSYGNEFKNVELTDEEYQKLVSKFGEKNTLILIEEMDAGIESKGYKYKSHYAAMLNWGKRKVEEYIKNKSKPKMI